MALRFEWDKRKADSNLRAHGVSFHEATTVFADPLSITISDPDHSMAEMRFVDIGLSYRGRLLVVSYAERADRIRVISARLAMNEDNMKKRVKTKARVSNRMRPEYDFSKGVRAKHAARYASGTNVVVLAPDVSSQFPTADDVNQALRAVSRLIERSRSRSKRRRA